MVVAPDEECAPLTAATTPRGRPIRQLDEEAASLSNETSFQEPRFPWPRATCMLFGLVFAMVGCVVWYVESMKAINPHSIFDFSSQKTNNKMDVHWDGSKDDHVGETQKEKQNASRKESRHEKGNGHHSHQRDKQSRDYRDKHEGFHEEFVEPEPEEHICNHSSPVLRNVHASVFNMTPEWNQTCVNMWHPAASDWPGRNWCWAWVKHAGCYVARGDITWADAQERTAQFGRAPHLNQQAMLPLKEPQICDVVAHGAPIEYTAEEHRKAINWIEKHVTMYVLNMDEDADRLDVFSARMRVLGLSFVRIPGLNISGIDAYDRAVEQGLIPRTFNYTRASAVADSDFQDMRGITGDVGTAAAHLRAMRQVMHNKAHTEIALVFEDDSSPHDDFAVKLYRMLIGEAPCDWEAITLRSRCPYGQCVTKHLSRVMPDGNEPQNRCRHGVNYGFYGILYRRQALKHIIDELMPVVWNEESPHCLDIDVALASSSDRVAFYAVPSSQMPGFLKEMNFGSSRRDSNKVMISSGEIG